MGEWAGRSFRLDCTPDEVRGGASRIGDGGACYHRAMAHGASCTCAWCGAPVPDPPLDYAYRLPDCVFALPEEERSPRCSRDFAELDGRRFVRCLIPVPVEGGQEFRYGIWIEVAPDTFERVVRAWNDPVQYRALAFAGRVANAFPPLGDRAVGAVVRLATRGDRSRPFVVDANDGPLASLLRRGWTLAEHLAVASALRS